jgi:hypothetical protein
MTPKKKTPGPWVRLAQDFHGNYKILTLLHDKQHQSVVVYVAALTWSAANLTDGLIPDYALAQVHGRRADADRLTSVGLWIPDPAGWRIHGWDQWQETNETRTQHSERMSRLALQRWHGDGAPVTRIDARRTP